MPFPRPTRPRVALVVDTEGWAFANIARQLEAHLSAEFDFCTIPLDAIGSPERVLLMTEGFDLTHFFWRDHLRLLGSGAGEAYATRMMGDWRSFAQRFVERRLITTAVYDHLLLDDPSQQLFGPILSERVDRYYVCSRRLDAIYRGLARFPAPAAVLEDGVDLALFEPRDLDRFRDIGRREIVVGWSGNSRWAAELGDPKGVRTILQPALDELRREGLQIKSLFADRATRLIAHAEMPDYYRQIDLLVCVSQMEGTPNPVLEAMACGVPVVSTDVGIVPDAFGPAQAEYLLADRSVAALKAAIRRLAEHPESFAALSRENLAQIRAWDWGMKAHNFARFFEGALASRRSPTRVVGGRC